VDCNIKLTLKDEIKNHSLYCILNENYTFGIGVRNYLRAVRKGLRTPNGHHKSVSLKRNAV